MGLPKGGVQETTLSNTGGLGGAAPEYPIECDQSAKVQTDELSEVRP